MIPGLWGAVALVLGPAWLWARREGYSGVARGLTGAELARLSPYFSRELLNEVRVAEVARIEEPLMFENLRAAGVRVPVDLSGVYGMCFGDVVAVTSQTMRERGLSTLFHELVHSAQMRRVGQARFCRVYVREYLAYGYTGIGFEEEAFEAQGRFERGEVFEVF